MICEKEGEEVYVCVCKFLTLNYVGAKKLYLNFFKGITTQNMNTLTISGETKTKGCYMDGSVVRI